MLAICSKCDSDHSLNIFYQINTPVALSDAKFVVPPQASIHSFVSPRTSCNLHTFTNATARCTSVTKSQDNRTHHDTRFWSTSWYEQDNSKKLWHMIPWRRLWHFKTTKRPISPIRLRPFCIRAPWLGIPVQLSPHPLSNTIGPIRLKSFYLRRFLLDHSSWLYNLLWSVR